ncbi:MAG: hypothetical protein CMF57_13035 [Leifsonia sp.]|nr:hypothetical protein [Leifsonia sp.]
MTRALEATQDDRATSSAIVPVDLIRLTTYSDRVALTVANTYHFSRFSCYWDFFDEGTSRFFSPHVSEIGLLGFTMNHIPGQQDDGLLARGLEVRLANNDLEGERLAVTLLADNLAGARVDWHQLLISEAELVAHTSRVDLAAYAGDEATVLYEGRVLRANPVTDREIVLSCETELPSVNWLRATDETKTDPRDLGKRFPVVYGRAERVQAINYEVGFVTTLAEQVTESDTGTVQVTDTTGFQSSGGAGMIGTESVTWSGKTATTLTGFARGANSTDAQGHKAGDSIVETISTLTFVVAGHEVDAINDVYLKTPSQELVRLDAAEFAFTTNTADTIDGETVATVTFTAAQWRSAIDSLSVEVVPPTGATSEEIEQVYSSFGTFENPNWHYGSNFGGDDMEVISQDGSGFLASRDDDNKDGGVFYFGSGASGSNGTKTVTRYKVALEYDFDPNSATGSQSAAVYVFLRDYPDGPGSVNIGTLAFTKDGDDGAVNNAVWTSDWINCSSGVQIEDFEGTLVHTNFSRSPQMGIALKGGGTNTTQLRFLFHVGGGSKMTFECPIESTGSEVTGGIKFGIGANLFCDVDGYKAPAAASPAYKSGNGNLIEKPCDVLRHWVEEVGGFTVDSDTYDDAETNLGANVLAFDARALGLTWEQALARMAFESRTNVVPEQVASGVRWRMLAAESDYAFPAAPAGAVLEDWAAGDAFTLGDVDLVTQASTRFVAYYAFDASRGTGEEAYRETLRADADSNDLSTPTTGALEAAEARLGRVDAAPINFLCIQDAATARDVLGYIAAESIRETSRVYAVHGAPHWTAYKLQPGDLVSCTPPWGTSSVKLRILSIGWEPSTEAHEIRAVEVT